MHPDANPAPAAQKPSRRPRTVRPDPAPDSFAARVRDTMRRLHLNEASAAKYLGVPVFTLRKWATGERQPGAAVLRLFDVLGMVEAMAPSLHASFMPSESRHAKKSGAKRSTGSAADPAMPKNPV